MYAAVAVIFIFDKDICGLFKASFFISPIDDVFKLFILIICILIVLTNKIENIFASGVIPYNITHHMPIFSISDFKKTETHNFFIF